jgi:hypothetical protein
MNLLSRYSLSVLSGLLALFLGAPALSGETCARPFAQAPISGAQIDAINQLNESLAKKGCESKLNSAQEIAVITAASEIKERLVRGDSRSSARSVSELLSELSRISADPRGLPQAKALAIFTLAQELDQWIRGKALAGQSLSETEIASLAQLSGKSQGELRRGFSELSERYSGLREQLFAEMHSPEGVRQARVDERGRIDFSEMDLRQLIQDPKRVTGLLEVFPPEVLAGLRDMRRQEVIVHQGYAYLPPLGSPEKCAEVVAQSRPRSAQALKQWQEDRRLCRMSVMPVEQYQRSVHQRLESLEKQIPQYVSASKRMNAWANTSSNIVAGIGERFGAQPSITEDEADWRARGDRLRDTVNELRRLGLESGKMAEIQRLSLELSKLDAQNQSKALSQIDSAIRATWGAVGLLTGLGALSGVALVSSASGASSLAATATLASSAAGSAALIDLTAGALKVGTATVARSLTEGGNPFCYAAEAFVDQAGDTFESAFKSAVIGALSGGAAGGVQAARAAALTQKTAVLGKSIAVAQRIAASGAAQKVAQGVQVGSAIYFAQKAVRAGVAGAQECLDSVTRAGEASDGVAAVMESQMAQAISRCSQAGIDLVAATKQSVDVANRGVQLSERFKPVQKQVESVHNFLKRDVTFGKAKVRASDDKLVQSLDEVNKRTDLIKKIGKEGIDQLGERSSGESTEASPRAP